MKPPPHRLAAVLNKLIQRVNESDDKSLFGLLCLIEQRTHTPVRKNVKPRIENHVTVKLVSQRPSAISKLTRYVE
jgi:hypothetical protein